ncbi:RCC1 domain-containing protein [Legionella hackeliae]|uniref:Regulator of chromosome condensation, RCC1 n=1 Tax=Legionella hackeliae TaxID=449 RepID=A0A0A8USC7_LEGHA|nr:hypothetical protein [Legionella hackeliae]CEK10441.1 protein of unknown function [Legionella hackeliae]STX47177.1 Cell cycle control protein [Legionella hackeliae]
MLLWFSYYTLINNMPSSNQTLTTTISNLPFEVICYLAFNFLDFKTAFYFINWEISNRRPPGADKKSNISLFYQNYHLKELFFKNMSHITIHANENSSIYLSNQNEIYVWGRYLHSSKNFNPRKLSLPPNTVNNFSVFGTIPIVKIAVSDHHILLLSLTGKVYLCEVNSETELSSMNTGDFTPQRIKIPLDKKITDVALCSTHALCLTSEGNVYKWEIPAHPKKTEPSFELMEKIKHEVITNIYVRPYHSMCITDKGAVYSFGYNPNAKSMSPLTIQPPPILLMP